MADSQAALVGVVLLDSLAAMAVIGGYWLAALLLQSFGRKVGYSLAPLGFSRPGRGYLRGIGAGVAVGVGAILLSWVVNPLSVLVLERLGYSTKSTIQRPFMEGLVRWVRDSPGTAVPAIILVVVLFGPAVEELVFRGAIFNGLYRLGAMIFNRSAGSQHPKGLPSKTIFAFSALASSMLFALLHLEPVFLPVLLILAITLCALFQRTGSLLPCFIAHATFNSFVASLLILVGLGILDVPI